VFNWSPKCVALPLIEAADDFFKKKYKIDLSVDDNAVQLDLPIESRFIYRISMGFCHNSAIALLNGIEFGAFT
jgi:hypothetical protein